MGLLRAPSDLTTNTTDLHRPWPMPWWPWVLFMRWHDVLFLHWPVQPSLVRRCLPRNLHLDIFEGQAWITISPLRMTNVRPRCTLSIPGFSSLSEVNVRTYVELDGKPGVWFFSLDANHWPAVQAARSFFALPYYSARARFRRGDGMMRFTNERTDCSAPAATFECGYRPIEALAKRLPVGSLDHWLLERYCMYSLDERDRLYRTEIHHEPWYVQRVDVQVDVNTMTLPLEIPLCGTPLAHFAKRQEVMAWLPRRLTRGVKL